MIDYSIQAIPTTYAGIRFRSRLEATWAAMFDLLGWRWEYECDPIGGWLPDFMIKAEGAGGVLLAEVKPVFNFPEEVAAKIRSATGQEALILGMGPFESEYWVDDAALGWLFDDSTICNDWGEAILNNYDGYGVFHATGYYMDRITGKYDGDHLLKPVALADARALWGQAKRTVQYRHPAAQP